MGNSNAGRLYSAERKLLEQTNNLPPEIIPYDVETAQPDDLSELLKEINEIKNLIEHPIPGFTQQSDTPELVDLREQLQELGDHIHQTKLEIASIHQPGGRTGRLPTAAIQLNNIVTETELATHRILNSSEEIEDILNKIKDQSNDVGTHDLVDQVVGKVTDIFESCNFQDISGQRTTKVIKTINYLEERILSMIQIWGVEGFDGVEIEILPDDKDDALLQGPEIDGLGVKQSEIDAMFE